MNNPFIGELIGTMLLIIFGDGVVANVVLNKTKGENSGWMVIATGWGMAIAVAVYASGPISGAHLNPAVTISLALIGKFPWASVAPYITIAWRKNNTTEYALEGSVFIAGAVVQWLRDGLGFIRAAPESEALAAKVEDTGGVYLVPAFVGLGAPHWDAYARGTIVGLTRGSTAAHITRAALESIAFQVVHVLAAMEADSGIKVAELRADGGASANNLLMQFQADLLGVPVVRASNKETTAMGAAYLAGLAVGYYKSTDEIASNRGSDRTFEPKMGSDERQKLRAGWNEALDRTKARA